MCVYIYINTHTLDSLPHTSCSPLPSGYLENLHEDRDLFLVHRLRAYCIEGGPEISFE